MDKFLIKPKRSMNSDESVIETKVHKVSETSLDVKTRRECLTQKANKKDRKYHTVTSSLDSFSMLKKVSQNVFYV